MFRDPFVAPVLVADTLFYSWNFTFQKLEIFTKWGGLCLLSFGLFFRGSSFTGFYPFATLTSVLHLKDRHQSN